MREATDGSLSIKKTKDQAQPNLMRNLWSLGLMGHRDQWCFKRRNWDKTQRQFVPRLSIQLYLLFQWQTISDILSESASYLKRNEGELQFQSTQNLIDTPFVLVKCPMRLFSGQQASDCSFCSGESAKNIDALHRSVDEHLAIETPRVRSIYRRKNGSSSSSMTSVFSHPSTNNAEDYAVISDNHEWCSFICVSLLLFFSSWKSIEWPMCLSSALSKVDVSRINEVLWPPRTNMRMM
jgi:hypothetical protein